MSIDLLCQGGNPATVKSTMKSVVAVHDLSCYGKSSLTIVIPTLSAMHIEVSPLATALLSTHTDGFEGYYYADLTDAMQAILSHWQDLDLHFDAVYSGFLGSERQIDTAISLIAWQRQSHDPLVLVDPVLGDEGVAYGPISDLLIKRMGTLAAAADVITPNLTEAAFLLGEQYRNDISAEEALLWAKRLSALGPAYVAITGVVEGTYGYVAAYDHYHETMTLTPTTYAPVSYPGCGDFFASLLCGHLLCGIPFADAVRASTSFVSEAVHISWNEQVERRHGILIERVIGRLARETT